MFTFIETTLFTRLVQKYLSDEEYIDLQNFLIVNPEAGDLIPSYGGLRVIYHTKTAQRTIWMLTIYAKNVAENIPAHILRQIKKEIENG